VLQHYFYPERADRGKRARYYCSGGETRTHDGTAYETAQ